METIISQSEIARWCTSCWELRLSWDRLREKPVKILNFKYILNLFKTSFFNQCFFYFQNEIVSCNLWNLFFSVLILRICSFAVDMTFSKIFVSFIKKFDLEIFLKFSEMNWSKKLSKCMKKNDPESPTLRKLEIIFLNSDFSL